MVKKSFMGVKPLRMEDKCGNLSNFADRARFRIGEKEIARKKIENESQ